MDGKNTFNSLIFGFGPDFVPEDVIKPGGFVKAFREFVGREDVEIDEPLTISHFRQGFRLFVSFRWFLLKDHARPNMRVVDKLQDGRVFILGGECFIVLETRIGSELMSCEVLFCRFRTCTLSDWR